MAKFELKLPKMGESVAEATITSWLKKVGDTVEMDEAVVEIATDKVDSEVPSEVEGTLVEILFEKDTVAAVGDTLAIIETTGDVNFEMPKKKEKPKEVILVEKTVTEAEKTAATPDFNSDNLNKFYSPLVKNIAKKEGISIEELNSISGSGKEGRVTKDDVLLYVKNNGEIEPQEDIQKIKKSKDEQKKNITPITSTSESDEIIEMSRMGKLISKHMIDSVQTSAHVQSFIEIDVTNIVNWRNNVKDAFFKREREKLTFTPIFIQAIANTIKKYPLINITVNGDTVIKKKNINIGMAAALPDGNLIVPVIKNADQLNLVGITKQVNDLANRSRNNALKPDEIQGGTYTVTNIGSFGSIMGTPIINQPQVAILALGAIRKVPAVVETPDGDFIGIRHKMFVSHSYDHRVVNGALGGMFIKTLKDILEAWDINADY